MGAKEEEIIVVEVKLRSRDLDQLQVIAEVEGSSPADVLRQLIRDAVSKHAEAELKKPAYPSGLLGR